MSFPKRSLGQNFLNDKNIIKKIISLVKVKNKNIVEIGPGKGAASFDESGNALYTNRRSISSSDRTLINAFRTISGMCDRINLPRTITDRANA